MNPLIEIQEAWDEFCNDNTELYDDIHNGDINLFCINEIINSAIEIEQTIIESKRKIDSEAKHQIMDELSLMFENISLVCSKIGLKHIVRLSTPKRFSKEQILEYLINRLINTRKAIKSYSEEIISKDILEENLPIIIEIMFGYCKSLELYVPEILKKT